MTLAELDTPALLIDLDVMERNLARAAQYAASNNLALRPHIKTHKIPALAQKQLALGARGITCAKPTEAEVMLEANPPELLLAYPVYGEAKLRRVVELARQTNLLIALDDPATAQPLSAAAAAAGVRIGILAELDAGLGRVGVDPDEHLVELIGAIRSMPSLTYRGIVFYPGHIKEVDDTGMAALDQVAGMLERTLGMLSRSGMNPEIVSGGSTPALFQSHRMGPLTEIRPGTYIFNDRNTVHSRACAPEDCAATILTTVVSTARPDQMILDGGSKTFSSDRLSAHDDQTFGLILEAPGSRFFRMNEEHGYVNMAGCERRFEVGERVRVVPNHVCVAMNLHERVYGIRDGQVESVWDVKARGKLQ